MPAPGSPRSFAEVRGRLAADAPRRCLRRCTATSATCRFPAFPASRAGGPADDDDVHPGPTSGCARKDRRQHRSPSASLLRAAGRAGRAWCSSSCPAVGAAPEQARRGGRQPFESVKAGRADLYGPVSRRGGRGRTPAIVEDDPSAAHSRSHGERWRQVGSSRIMEQFDAPTDLAGADGRGRLQGADWLSGLASAGHADTPLQNDEPAPGRRGRHGLRARLDDLPYWLR